MDKLIQMGQLVRENEPIPWGLEHGGKGATRYSHKTGQCLHLPRSLPNSQLRPVYHIATLEEDIHHLL